MKVRKFEISKFLALGAVLALAGCASSPAPAARVLVPVPVECREPVPERPTMPTELLLPGAHPWVVMRAALAEIDRREGYEVQLRAALLACTAPVQPP